MAQLVYLLVGATFIGIGVKEAVNKDATGAGIAAFIATVELSLAFIS